MEFRGDARPRPRGFAALRATNAARAGDDPGRLPCLARSSPVDRSRPSSLAGRRPAARGFRGISSPLRGSGIPRTPCPRPRAGPPFRGRATDRRVTNKRGGAEDCPGRRCGGPSGHGDRWPIAGAIGGVLPRSGIETSAGKGLMANGLFALGANKSLMGEGVRGYSGGTGSEALPPRPGLPGALDPERGTTP